MKRYQWEHKNAARDYDFFMRELDGNQPLRNYLERRYQTTDDSGLFAHFADEVYRKEAGRFEIEITDSTLTAAKKMLQRLYHAYENMFNRALLGPALAFNYVGNAALFRDHDFGVYQARRHFQEAMRPIRTDIMDDLHARAAVQHRADKRRIDAMRMSPWGPLKEDYRR